jgi:hypothetical protein
VDTDVIVVRAGERDFNSLFYEKRIVFNRQEIRSYFTSSLSKIL